MPLRAHFLCQRCYEKLEETILRIDHADQLADILSWFHEAHQLGRLNEILSDGELVQSEWVQCCNICKAVDFFQETSAVFLAQAT